MICFNYFHSQRSKISQGENYKRKPGVICIICGEKIRDWPTNRLGHKE